MDYTELLPPDEVASLAAGLEVLDPHDKVWREFAALAIAAAAPAIRKAERERTIAAITHLRDSHCAGTKLLEDERDWCEPNDLRCELVVAWNDALAAIRALPEEPHNVQANRDTEAR